MWQTCWKREDEEIKQIILMQNLHSKNKTFLSLDCIFDLVKVVCTGRTNVPLPGVLGHNHWC